MGLTRRAYDVYQKEGTLGFTKSSLKFVNKVASPRVAGVSFLSKNVDVLNREELRRYCEESPEADILYYSKAESFTFEEPLSFDPLPDRFRSVLGDYKLQQPFVGEVRDAHILRNGVAANSEYDLILESSMSRRDLLEKHFVENPSELLSVRRQQRSGSETPENDLELACSLIHAPVSVSQNVPKGERAGHSHTVMATLPRLEGLRRYEEETGEEPVILFGSEPRSIVKEAMELLGFGEERWTVWDGEPTHVKRLIVPSIRKIEHDVSYYSHRMSLNSDYKIMSAEACRWMRETMLENINGDREEYPNKILVSREDASNRKVGNNDEFVKAMEEHGFVSYELSKLPFREQVKLFSEADAVVGPHGAGLVNLVFSRDCKVLELFGYKTKPTYMMLSSVLGLEYGMLRCESEGFDADMRVDLKRLEEILAEMGVVERY